jgi:hypothetical protein
MREARVQDLIRRQHDVRFRRAMQLTDGLVEELEDLNLTGRSRLTHRMRARLLETVQELPGGCGSGYQDTILVQRALDQLFNVQENILRERFPDFDGEEDYLEDWFQPAAS